MNEPLRSPLPEPAFLSGGGELGRLISAHDWSATSLGPLEGWPRSLRTMLGVVLRSPVPMVLLWGEAGILLYNDAYAAFAGARHPGLLGAPVREAWPEAASFSDEAMRVGLAGGALSFRDQELTLPRPGRPERAWMDLDYSAVPGNDGEPAGVLCILAETTERVAAERRREELEATLRASEARLRVLHELDDALRASTSATEAMDAATALLARQLGASRCAYADVDADNDRFIIRSDHSGPGLDSSVGTYSLDLFGPRAAAAMREGHTLVVRDVEGELAPGEGREMFRAIGIDAIICCPLVKDGRLRAMMAVHQVMPRDWRADEAALVEAAVERCWAYVERAGAEARLRDSEARFRALFEQSPLMIHIFEPSGRTRAVNPALTRSFGLPAEALGDYNIFDDPQMRDGERRQLLDRMFRGEVVRTAPLRHDAAVSTGEGTARWVEALGFPVLDEAGAIREVVVLTQDVTDTQEAQEALRASEAQFRAFAQAVPNHVWAARPDGGLYWFNDQVYAYCGEAEGTLDGSSWARIVHPDDVGTAGEAWARALTAGEVYETEFRIRRGDGTYRWFLVRAEPVRGADDTIANWVGTNTDIHDRKLAEARLRELNETLETRVAERTAERDRLWTLSEDMLARADYQGMMSAVSPAWTRVLGWTEAELLSRPYATFMHPEDAEVSLAALTRMGETGQPTRFENRIATKDGGWRPIEWIVAPEPDSPHFIAVGRDLSVVKAQEEELRQAQEQLRQSQKMEAMGQLTGGVAHDFNNLLTPIIASLDMLLRRGVGSERERRLMDGALQSAERAKTLVQRLLAFARRQPLQSGPVDVRRLVTDMAELIASTSGPRIDLRLDLPADLPPALADANQLEMAILNLAVNARDAMPEGGTLSVTATRQSVRPGHPLGPRSSHSSGLRPGHYLRLSVADTGIGMDEATLARAVEPFFSTKGVGRGTGLGLSMVHGLAEQLGGGLKIKSRPGQGTTVDLWLPISPFAAEPDDKESSAETPRQARGTALLVDDEDLVRLSTADMLMDLGYEVVEAASAEAALRLVGEGLHPSLVITDHLMPGMSGVDLARELRAQRPDLPVLIVSGYAEMEGIAPGLPRLTKPFRQAELAQTLAKMVPETGRPW